MVAFNDEKRNLTFSSAVTRQQTFRQSAPNQ